MMKNSKLILLLIFVTILSCSDNEEKIFTLNTANLAGNYTIKSIIAEDVETATSNGVNISTSTYVADSFDDINIIMNTNGTYIATGKFRAVTTETDNGGTPETDNEIVVFDDAGSYTLNTTQNTILFISTKDDDFFDGEYKVQKFNENTLDLFQEDIDLNGGITTTSKINFSLERN